MRFQTDHILIYSMAVLCSPSDHMMIKDFALCHYDRSGGTGRMLYELSQDWLQQTRLVPLQLKNVLWLSRNAIRSFCTSLSTCTLLPYVLRRYLCSVTWNVMQDHQTKIDCNSFWSLIVFSTCSHAIPVCGGHLLVTDLRYCLFLTHDHRMLVSVVSIACRHSLGQGRQAQASLLFRHCQNPSGYAITPFCPLKEPPRRNLCTLF